MLFVIQILLLASAVSYSPNCELRLEDYSETPISLSELGSRGVTGQLGLKLGTVVIISGKVISGDTLNTKDAAGRFYLEVSHVDGTPLASKVVLPFRVKRGVNRSGLNTAGQSFKLKVFEEGEFTGLPGGLELDEQWSEHLFGYSSFLTIVKNFDPKGTPTPPSPGFSITLVGSMIFCTLVFVYRLMRRRSAR